LHQVLVIQHDAFLIRFGGVFLQHPSELPILQEAIEDLLLAIVNIALDLCELLVHSDLVRQSENLMEVLRVQASDPSAFKLAAVNLLDRMIDLLLLVQPEFELRLVAKEAISAVPDLRGDHADDPRLLLYVFRCVVLDEVASR